MEAVLILTRTKLSSVALFDKPFVEAQNAVITL